MASSENRLALTGQPCKVCGLGVHIATKKAVTYIPRPFKGVKLPSERSGEQTNFKLDTMNILMHLKPSILMGAYMLFMVLGAVAVLSLLFVGFSFTALVVLAIAALLSVAVERRKDEIQRWTNEI